MALDTNNAAALISGPRQKSETEMKNPQVLITRNCGVRGRPIKAGQLVTVEHNEAQQIIGARRGVMYDPKDPEHKKAKTAKVPVKPGSPEELDEN